MSRSNGSQPQPAGHAPQASGYDVNPDPRAWNPRQPAAAPQAAPVNPAAPQYQAAPAYQSAPQRPAQTQQPAYTDPYAQHGGYYQAPSMQTAGRGAQPQSTGSGYTAAQFDPYVPAQPAYQPAPAAQAAAPYPDLRGGTFDQWAGQQPAQPQPDLRGYDLSNYGNDHQLSYASARPAQIVGQQPSQAARATEWPQAQSHQGQYGQQSYDAYQAHADAQAHAGSLDYAAAAGQHDPHHQGYDEGYAADGSGEAMEDDAPRGRRGMLIAATLAGAIFVGGGLTYAYNALLGPGAGGTPPLVKSASGPAKVKPAEPGGKQFDHADSKVLGRLNDNDTASSSATDAAGSKKVSTLVVKPDGTIEPPAPAAAVPEPAASGQSAAAVAGMSVVNVGGTAEPASPAPAAPEAKSAGQQVAAAANPAPKTVVVNQPAAAPKAPAVISPAAAPAAPAAASAVETAAVAAPAAAEAVKKPAVVKKAAVTTAAATPAAAPASTGAGYMAVIASMPASAKSRMDALTRWADMQQKYGSILQSKTMDVQEANLGEKGTYHRLLVGPPGSKDTANSVCSQLKAAGHTDCWVMAY